MKILNIHKKRDFWQKSGKWSDHVPIFLSIIDSRKCLNQEILYKRTFLLDIGQDLDY